MRHGWRDWSRLSASEARDPADLEAASHVFEAYFDGIGPDSLPSPHDIVATGLDATLLAALMLERAARTALHDYAPCHQANRDFFERVVAGAFAYLVERPGFVATLQPAFVRHVVEGIGTIRIETGAIRTDVSVVREHVSGLEATGAATARALETTAAMLDRTLIEKQALGEEVTRLKARLRDAVKAVSDPTEVGATPDRMAEAVAALERGDTTVAERLFEEEAEHQLGEARQLEQSGSLARRRAAEAWRRQGVLAYLHDTHRALRAYARATQAWSEDVDAWNELGLLQRRVGDFDQAEHTFRVVLELADRTDEPAATQALGQGNLGLVYLARGAFDRAEVAFERSLELNEFLGRDGRIIDNCNNLDIVYRARGRLDRAETVCEKLIEANRALGRADGLAGAYGNLGLVYRDRGKLDEAEQAFGRSLVIFKSLGRNEGVARTYDNLGVVYTARGEFPADANASRRPRHVRILVNAPHSPVLAKATIVEISEHHRHAREPCRPHGDRSRSAPVRMPLDTVRACRCRTSPDPARIAELANTKLELEIRKLERWIRLREIGRSVLIALAVCLVIGVGAVLVVVRLPRVRIPCPPATGSSALPMACP